MAPSPSATRRRLGDDPNPKKYIRGSISIPCVKGACDHVRVCMVELGGLWAVLILMGKKGHF